jgi:ankyrin repeat protein
VNAKEDNGWTPLHYCAREGHLEVARFLIKAGSIGFAKFHRELLWYSTTIIYYYYSLIDQHI